MPTLLALTYVLARVKRSLGTSDLHLMGIDALRITCKVPGLLALDHPVLHVGWPGLSGMGRRELSNL